MNGPKYLLFALVLSACGPASIDAVCTDISEAQCSKCFSCETGEVTGGELCKLSVDATESECRSSYLIRCNEQASTQEDPKDKLESCSDTIDELTCETLFTAYAQDHTATTDTCAPFL